MFQRVCIRSVFFSICFAMVFILSTLAHRYRFAEIRYHRPEETHKGRVVPARVETVVLFLPDVWSCNPSRIEWEGLGVAYKRQLADKFKQDQQQQQPGVETAHVLALKPLLLIIQLYSHSRASLSALVPSRLSRSCTYYYCYCTTCR